MPIRRCLAAVLLVGVMGGCASVGAGVGRSTPLPQPIGAADALDLLLLVEEVEAAARAASAAD